MNNVLLLLVFAGLVGLLLVVFYLLDRVNALHNQSETTRLKRPFTDTSMATMNGRILWDVLSGEAMQELDEEMISQLRSRYEMVLQKHIELLFEDGTLDGREGFSMPVSPERKVPTLRGEFISWIPHEFAKGVYMAGHSRATQPESEHPAIAAALDNIGNELFEQVGMPPVKLSKLLMPNTEPHIPSPIAEVASQAAALNSDIPALPAPELQPAALMMVANMQGESMPMSNAVALDPVTGAPIPNVPTEQIAATANPAAAGAMEQSNAAPASSAANAAPEAGTASSMNSTVTPTAADTASPAMAPVEANASDNNKSATPEKVK